MRHRLPNFNSQKGVSIMGALIGASVLLVAALGTISVFNSNLKSAKQVDMNADATQVVNEITWLLSDEPRCIAALGGQNAISTSAGVVSKMIYLQADGTQTPRFPTVALAPTQMIGSSRVQVDSYELNDKSDEADVAAQTSDLYINLKQRDSADKTTHLTNLTRRVRLFVEVDAAKKILRCRALGLDEDLWKRSPVHGNNIYYPGGNVGIGTDDPGSLFEIKNADAGIYVDNHAALRSIGFDLSRRSGGWKSFGLNRVGSIAFQPLSGSFHFYAGAIPTSGSFTDLEMQKRYEVGLMFNDANFTGFSVSGSGKTSTGMSAFNFTGTNPTDSAGFMSWRARGTKETPTHPQTNDLMGYFAANNPIALQHNAGSGMEILATEAHQNTKLGMKVEIMTTPNGTVQALPRLTVDQNGNVGIGERNPSAILHVKGNSETGGFVDCIIKTSASGLQCTSDRRLKTEIEPLHDSLRRLLKIQAVSFRWRDSRKAPRNLGVIAQEVEAEFPELVDSDPRTGIKRVSYSGLVAPILEALREIWQAVTGLDGRIEKLEKENAQLRRRLDQLEAGLSR